MANAASKFLASLTPEQRQQATFAVDSEELTRWHYVPAQQFPRNGLPIRAMTETQRGLAHELMKTGLSQRGYTQATTIMVDLENILKAIENGSAMRDPELLRMTAIVGADEHGVARGIGECAQPHKVGAADDRADRRDQLAHRHRLPGADVYRTHRLARCQGPRRMALRGDRHGARRPAVLGHLGQG